MALWEVLLPVIVGGGLTLAGGHYLQTLQSKTEKQKRRAEKFEELVTAVYEHERWLGDMRNHRIFGEPSPETLSPLAKVHAISIAYFPELGNDIEQLESAARDYEMWMLDAAQKRIASGNADTSGHQEAVRAYVGAMKDLLLALRSVSRQEFQQ
jgi:hypothetical protein